MVVVCSPNYDSGQVPLVVRVRNAISGNTFEVRVQRADGSTTPISGVPVHYMAVEAGTFTLAEHGITMEAVKFSSTVTDNDSSWLGENRTYSNSYVSPVVLGQVMTENDARFSVFWSRGSSQYNPPSNSTLRVGKTVCEDPDLTRADETIGYIVVESGSGTLDGTPYATALGADLVLGIDNAPPYAYALSGLSSASVAIATQAGMDGFNGGWAVLYGPTPVTATSLQLVVDEDQLQDAERFHTSEQVSFIVFDKFNEPPLANDDAYSGQEDDILTIAAPGVLDNDSDPTGDALTPLLISGPTDGNLTLNADGSFSYTPNPDFFGTDSFTYQANDGIATSNAATVTITINPVNDAPVADDQSVVSAEDTAVAITLTASDLDGDPLTYNVVAGPADGTLSGTAPDLIYTPDPGFAGVDQFTFQANDGTVDSNTAAVSITVISSGPRLEMGVVSNVTNSSWATVQLPSSYSDMVVVCSPNYDSGQVPLVVRVRNAASGNNFEVRVQRADGSTTPISGVPVHYMVVETGTYTMAHHDVPMEAVKFTSTVTDNDSSWLGESRTYSNSYVSPVVLGQVMTENDARFSVFWSRGSSQSNPPSNSTLRVGKTVCEDPDLTRADETIGYIVVESGSGTLDGTPYATALGADLVLGIDDAPPYAYALSGLSSASVAIATQAGMDGFNGGWAVLYGPTPVTATSLQLVVDEDELQDAERFHTSEQVSFIVFDKFNEPPLANDDAYSGQEDDILTIAAPGVLDNDSDPTGDALTPLLISGPTDGNLTLNADGSFSYTPNPDFFGTDSFTYQANDGIATSNAATVTITINPVNDAPVADDQSVVSAEDTAVAITLTASDLDGDPLTYNVVAGPADGTLSGTAPDLIYTPDPGFSGADQFTFQANDGTVDSNTAAVSITVVSSGPRLEMGVVSNVTNSSWSTVQLPSSYSDMVVVCSPNYDSGQVPLVVRVRNAASGNNFEVRVQRADGSTTPISGVPVHYMVVETGTYTMAQHDVTMEAVKFTSTVTDNDSSWLGESRTYSNSYVSPVVLGQVMTENDARFSVFWSSGSSRTNPPSNSTLRVGKTVCEDPDLTRADETIGYIVVESGSGTLDGTPYATALGADLVLGIDNAPPYAYALSGLSSASVAIATQAGMDGFNGGWAVLYGPTPVTATSLQLVIDEDQLQDAERFHTSEQVSFIVFE